MWHRYKINSVLHFSECTLASQWDLLWTESCVPVAGGNRGAFPSCIGLSTLALVRPFPVGGGRPVTRSHFRRLGNVICFVLFTCGRKPVERVGCSYAYIYPSSFLACTDIPSMSEIPCLFKPLRVQYLHLQ